MSALPTPGPWTFVPAPPETDLIGEIRQHDQHGPLIALLCQDEASADPDGEAADGRRMAAAPELVALLRRLRGWDHLDSAGDGAYWRGEIDAVLA